MFSVPKRDVQFPSQASQMSCVPERDSCIPERDTQKCKKKILILNLNNFFLGIFKKNSERSKLDNLFIVKLPKFGGDWLKNCDTFFFVFRGYYKNDQMMPDRVSSY